MIRKRKTNLIHIILFLFCCLVIEFTIKLKIIRLFKKILSLYKKLYLLLSRKKISDNWKEKMNLYYSFEIIKLSTIFIFFISCIFLFLLILDFLFSGLFYFALSLLGIFETFVFIICYLKIKEIVSVYK